MVYDIVLDVNSSIHDAVSILNLCQAWQPQCSVTLHSILTSLPIVAVDQAASGQELLAHLLNTMDQQHNTSQQ